MEQNSLPEKSDKFFPVAKYDIEDKKANGVSFTGSPIKHPYDNEKFLLISDPLSDHTQFFEFHKTDVVFVKELTSMSTDDGENFQMTRLWIKQGVMAVRYEPFVVGKTSSIIDDLRK